MQPKLIFSISQSLQGYIYIGEDYRETLVLHKGKMVWTKEKVWQVLAVKNTLAYLSSGYSGKVLSQKYQQQRH